MGYDPVQWHDFGVALAGVGAALTGLLFVAVSINITRILAAPSLPVRAGETLTILVSQVVVALLLLVPGQSHVALGVELVLFGLVLATVFLVTRLHAYRDREPTDPAMWTYSPMLIITVSTGPLLIGGITLIAGTGGGLYWVVAGALLGVVGASSNAWIFLVEILR